MSNAFKRMGRIIQKNFMKLKILITVIIDLALYSSIIFGTIFEIYTACL